jgi:hypothetical protein
MMDTKVILSWRERARMAEFKRNKSADHRYRNKQKDTPPAVDLAASVAEIRRIYPEKSDGEFTAWYARRYCVAAADVYRILREVRDGEERSQVRR